MKQLVDGIQVGVIGSGTMGAGIAQIAATKGHRVQLIDSSEAALGRARESLEKILARLEEKGRIESGQGQEILSRISFSSRVGEIADCAFVIEAIVEDLQVKKQVFGEIERATQDDAVLATNTSSLSIASIGSACEHPERVIGVHFFNPAPLMPLVEIIPGIATAGGLTAEVKRFIDGWGKTTVIAKDTPGFIVNRVARPFYGESIRLLEEGVADVATIDWAFKEIGGFRMGPFELMDLIGNDINLAVTETVFREFFYDPRFKPSFTQKRLVEAGYLGRKSGRGYYQHGDGAQNPEPDTDRSLGEQILMRVLVMLINEAADAVFMQIASPQDIDLAMTKGVNYPKGLLAWADELGIQTVLDRIVSLYEEYREDRYRPNPLLQRMADRNESFHG